MHARVLSALAPRRAVAVNAGKVAARPSDRRWALRKSGMVSALVAYHPIKSPVACIIRDMSATGAKLEIVRADWGSPIASSLDLPERFVLILRLDKIEVECGVVWRRGQQAGVRFLSSMRPLSRALRRQMEDGKKKP